MFVFARGGVGAAAGAEFEFAKVEVLLKLAPFGGGGLAVLAAGAQGASLVEEAAVGADEVVVEDREVALGGVEVLVAQEPGRDVHRQAAGDGLGGEHPSEVVRGVVQGVVRRVAQAGALQGLGEQLLDGSLADHFVAVPEFALEQVRQRHSAEAFVVVVAGDQRDRVPAQAAEPADDAGQDAGQFGADQEQSFLVAFGRDDL